MEINVNEKLIQIFEKVGIDAEQDEYIGKNEIYIVYTYADERPVFHGDNNVLAEKIDIQVQLVTPKEFDYFELKKEIKKALRNKGFFITSSYSFLGNVFMGTEKIRQTVFQVNYTEKI